MIDETTMVLEPNPLPDFVETKYIKDISKRALSYIKAGFPVHFRGVSGTGKTNVSLFIELVVLTAYVLYTYTMIIVFNTSVMGAWTSELVYGSLLGIVSWGYLKSNGWQKADI